MAVVDIHTHLLTREHLDFLTERDGPDYVLFGSDYPHNIGDGNARRIFDI
jgi:predicted TIM-barrel fold metal-dependent hydrolase